MSEGSPSGDGGSSADPQREILRLERRVRRLETTLSQVERIRDTNARVLDRVITDLDAERERSHELLLNVLPQHVIDRLAAGESTIADRHDDVAIVFADLVGFTAISSDLAPATLVTELNEMFSAFDEAADRLGMDKIKTIGDAYLAAAGLREGDAHAVRRAADLGLAMLESIATFGDRWRIRVGIHRGPVVAGVIGRRKFAYDVWGDTVNVASRLETTAGPGRIHVSDEVASALASEYVLESRGLTELKGKGRTRTWDLVGRKL